MLSLTHILLLVFVGLLVFGRTKISDVARAIGESRRNYRKAVRGEEDIDVTDSVRHLE